MAEQARQGARIEQLFRAWNRNRGDIDALQQLQAAIGDLLGHARAAVLLDASLRLVMSR